jgi:cytochrome P450
VDRGARVTAGGERITGLAYDPADPQFLADPSRYYRWLRDEAPAHRHAASGAVLLSRFQDVWNATLDPATFSSRSPVARLLHMASMDPPGHDRLRARVARSFAPARVAALEPTLRQLCRDLLDPLHREPRADLVRDFAAIFPSRAIHRLLGVPAALDEPLRACALGIGTAADAAALAAGMEELARLARRAVDEPSERRGLLQELQRDASAERLSDAELLGVCSNLVLAGTDTVTNLIGNGLVLLHRHPEARARLLRDAGLLPGAIEEMLRVESPVQSLARRTTRALVLHGVELAPGTEVRLMWGAANRDEREFERPDTFELDREIPRHLALGHGIHFCLGAGLARLEARVAFEEILARWPSCRVDEAGLVRVRSLWVRGFEHVPVRSEAH